MIKSKYFPFHLDAHVPAKIKSNRLHVCYFLLIALVTRKPLSLREALFLCSPQEIAKKNYFFHSRLEDSKM